jgi:hypothetical protein
MKRMSDAEWVAAGALSLCSISNYFILDLGSNSGEMVKIRVFLAPPGMTAMEVAAVKILRVILCVSSCWNRFPAKGHQIALSCRLEIDWQCEK